jgi:RNA polymerase sigma-70 factor (ECF subfamily)
MPRIEEAIEPHIPALRRYAWALSRYAQGADDLVQECLVRALGNWHLRRAEGSVRAWLFTILHHAVVSGRRKAWRSRQTEVDERATEPGQEHRLMLDEVCAALASLPDEQRAVVLLVGVEDFSYAEAARILGLPIGTVMSRLSRGRERIRKWSREMGRESRSSGE